MKYCTVEISSLGPEAGPMVHCLLPSYNHPTATNGSLPGSRQCCAIIGIFLAAFSLALRHLPLMLRLRLEAGQYVDETPQVKEAQLVRNLVGGG